MRLETLSSQEAYARTDTAKHRQAILRLLGDLGYGLTCDEIEQQLGLSHQTASARVSELAKDGRIVKTGERRPTRTGSMATCYALREVLYP